MSTSALTKAQRRKARRAAKRSAECECIIVEHTATRERTEHILANVSRAMIAKITATQLSFLREHWKHRSWAHPSWVPDWVFELEDVGFITVLGTGENLRTDAVAPGRVRAQLTEAGREFAARDHGVLEEGP